MPHKVFLSHKYEDKPIVEPIALRLREIFGEQDVFYDSWSIQPGDGIIEKINQGLAAPEFVFFFVSKLSLQSGIVGLEWQNALFKASKGQTHLIPVRIENVTMPPVLMQSLYIDAYTVGIEAALQQIVNVIQGNSTFTPSHLGFANLTYTQTSDPDGAQLLTVQASHLMEPNPNMLVLVQNTADEVQAKLNGQAPMLFGFHERPFSIPGVNGIAIAPMGGAITPDRPMRIKLIPQKEGVEIRVLGMIHGWEHPFHNVPKK